MKNTKQKSKKALRTAEYKTTFLTPTDFLARNGKTVYINKEFHQKLNQLVFMLGDGKLTLADYIHNLLQHHFDDFGAEMKEVYNNSDKLNF
ncbi:DUF3408 domain-containing protein [Chryseobacterium indologenes]|uniref:DUF3408 domain-containing protein n=1 Tax=Chryseobacterium indologenes TaxID=253 RepID=UPI00162AD174|nr:DUF3408 domain-containing protein [Chryseobacterium indologenes]